MRLKCLSGGLFLILYQVTPIFSQTTSSPANITVGPDDVSKLTKPCGPTVYCLPEKGDRWVVNKEYFVRWWNKYPTFLLGGYVNIKLYEATSPPTLVKQWLDITNDQGFYTVKNYPPQFPIFPPDPTRPNTTVTRECYFVILAPGSDESIAGKGDNFFIDDYNPPANSSSPTPTKGPPTSTGLSKSTNTNGSPQENYNDSSKPSLSTGAIIGIILGSIGLVTLVACVLLLIHRRKKSKAKEMLEANQSRAIHNPPSIREPIIRPLTSSTLQSDSSMSEVDFGTPLSSSDSVNRRSSLRLTVKDARLLSHTYRAMLSNNSLNGEETAQNNQRSLYSDELLRRELAAEGRGVKNVSTSPAIVVVNSDQMERDSMTADHSDHNELKK
ncbi:hypothetical protein K7432_003191 [Basidiobolus ranarum]|uniref:Mid2 domain-containing protein n=1 Tax=Basidiobolus ranarum TaxID=34480 RepID=A0ABR2W6K3_9FUNG